MNNFSQPKPSASSFSSQDNPLPQESSARRYAPDELDAIYATAPVGLCVLDTELRYVRINHRLAEINGLSVEDHRGKTVREVVPDLADKVEPILRRVIERGESVRDIEVRGETPARPGVERTWIENWLPIQDDRGTVIGINVVAQEVTEQHQTERALQRSQVRYRQLFEEIEDGLCVCEMLVDENNTPYDYRFLEVNPAFKDHSGLEDAVGKTLYQLVPEAEPYWLETYRRVALDGERIRFEQQSPAMGRWFSVLAFPFGPSGSRQFAVQFKDISAQKQAKEEVERQQQQLRSLFEQAPVAIAVVKGPRYVIDFANATYCELLGRPPKQVLNSPLFELLPEIADQGYQPLLDRVMTTGESHVAYESPTRIRRHGRWETLYWDFVYHPFRNESGEIVGTTMVAAEVGERVKARHKEEENERRSRTLLEGIPQMTWTNQPDGSVDFYSQRWFDYTGLTYEELRDWGWKPIVHPDDLPDMLPTYLRALETGEPFVHENRLKRHDGTYRWHLNRSEPLRDENGQISQWVGTSTDIHEKKTAEEALQKTTEELAAVNEELRVSTEEVRARNEELAATNRQLAYTNADLDNFVYTASHDLKAPITNIHGLLQLLESSLSSESRAAPRTQKVLNMMEKSVARFMETIADLSEITRLQKQANQPTEWLDLAPVIEEVRLDIAPAIEEADAQLDIDIANCGPICFAPKNLRSVVYNLLSNAVKYRDPQQTPRIRVHCAPTDGYQILTVADNGLGIDLSGDRQLFGMFQRFHDHVAGTGVGLYIVKKIIDNSGGRIEVESEIGVGTTFRVFFKQ